MPFENGRSIIIDESGNKWIGTEVGGVAKFDGNNWQIFNTDNSGLPHNTVNAMSINKNGNLWVGTRLGGLSRFNGNEWLTYNTSNSGLPSNEVYAITIDSSNNKWIGTAMGGLAVYNEDGAQVSVEENQILQSNIHVFPNPASDYFSIDVPPSMDIFEIEMMNLQGIIVFCRKNFDAQNKINISNLSNGLYLLRLKTDKGSMTTKLIKQ